MRLTAERCSGIKTGYWSQAKKSDLMQRLGAIEHRGSELLANVCKSICLHTRTVEKDLDGVCRECPVYELSSMISGGSSNAN